LANDFREQASVRHHNFLARLGVWTELSLSCLRAASPDEKLACEICDDAISVALAGSLAAEPAIEQGLEADREDDARHLHAYR